MYIGAADGAPADINKDPSAFNKFALTFPAFIFMSSYFVFAMNTYDTVLVCKSESIQSLKRKNWFSKKSPRIFTQSSAITSLG